MMFGRAFASLALVPAALLLLGASDHGTPDHLQREFARVCLANPVDHGAQVASLTSEDRGYTQVGEFAGGAIFESWPIQFRLKVDQAVTICTVVAGVEDGLDFEKLANQFAQDNELAEGEGENRSQYHRSWIETSVTKEHMFDIRLSESDGLATLTLGSIARPISQETADSE